MPDQRALVVGDCVASPGEKTVGVHYLPIRGDNLVQVPLFLVNGAESGPCLVVTAGFHGAEYASIEAALQLGRTLDPPSLRGRVIVAPVVNMPGFRARAMQVCPLDGKNLNRVFPGHVQGSASEQLANWIAHNVIGQADFYVDLHDGDLTESIVPFAVFHKCGDLVVDRRSQEMAMVAGTPYVVCRDVPGTATDYAACRLGIPSCVLEGGGQGSFLPEAVAVHLEGLERVLSSLDMRSTEVERATHTRFLDGFVWLKSECDGFYYPDVAVGDCVGSGQILGRVKDAWGTVLQRVIATGEGTVVVLQTSLSVRQGDALLAVGLHR